MSESRAKEKKAERERKKAEGFERKEYWIRPEWHEKILAFIEKLKRKKRGVKDE